MPRKVQYLTPKEYEEKAGVTILPTLVADEEITWDRPPLDVVFFRVKKDGTKEMMESIRLEPPTKEELREAFRNQKFVFVEKTRSEKLLQILSDIVHLN